jgi:hypothetical protein
MNRNTLFLLVCVSTFIALLTAAVVWWLDIPSLPNLDPEVHAAKAAKFFAELGPEEASPIEGFPFTLQLSALTDGGHSPHYHELRVDGMQLHINGSSPNQIPGDKESRAIETKVQFGPGLIDIWATNEFEYTPMPEYPAWRSEKGIYGPRLKPVWIPPDRPVYVRVRFKDSTELFALVLDSRGRLQIAEVQCRHGKAALRSSDGMYYKGKGKGSSRSVSFTHVECTEGEITYQCNPTGVFAASGNKLLWTRQLKIEGQPKSIHVVDKTLFVTTTADHCFYCNKSDGELLFYAVEEVLAGKDPCMEILQLGRKLKDRDALKDFQDSMERVIEGLVELEDKRAIPFLIECIDTTARTMALAGLEKLNGEPWYWDAHTPRPGPHAQGIERERLTPEGHRAEREKWRKAFQIR